MPQVNCFRRSHSGFCAVVSFNNLSLSLGLNTRLAKALSPKWIKSELKVFTRASEPETCAALIVAALYLFKQHRDYQAEINKSRGLSCRGDTTDVTAEAGDVDDREVYSHANAKGLQSDRCFPTGESRPKSGSRELFWLGGSFVGSFPFFSRKGFLKI